MLQPVSLRLSTTAEEGATVLGLGATAGGSQTTYTVDVPASGSANAYVAFNCASAAATQTSTITGTFGSEPVDISYVVNVTGAPQ